MAVFRDMIRQSHSSKARPVEASICVMENCGNSILNVKEKFLELNSVSTIKEEVPKQFHAQRHEWSFPLLC